MKYTCLLLGFLLCDSAWAQPVWTWQNPLPLGNTLNDVYFVDASTGWAAGAAGSILHTTNAGATWVAQSSGTTIDLEDIYFLDTQNGWVVGGNPGVILHTADGGDSWSAQITPTTDRLRAIHFVDAQTGWAAGGKTIWHTSDGGANWTNQATGPSTNRQFNAGRYVLLPSAYWTVFRSQGNDGNSLSGDFEFFVLPQ